MSSAINAARFMVIGAALIIIGMFIGFVFANDVECFDGHVQVSQYFPESGGTKSVIGDSTFCGEFGGTRGPSELYHLPHGEER